MPARTQPERLERLEDLSVQQALALQSHQSTIDLVLVPLANKSEERDQTISDLKEELAKAKASLKTAIWIFSGMLTVLGIILAAMGLVLT